jgi:glutamate racemase
MIGVYDSGYGGLSVLRHLRAQLPHHDFVYLGDSGRAPYGGRDVHTILDFAEQAIERLREEGCRLVVVACHTVSCVALRHLQRRYCGPASDQRVLGVTIPAAELAIQRGARRVGVLATARTVDSGTYVAELLKLDPQLEITQRAAPLLAAIVEEGWEQSSIADDAARRYLDALAGADAIILGCTHYPFLHDALRRAAGPDVELVDPAPFVARQLVDWLDRHPGFTQPGRGDLRILCTGDPATFAAHGARFLGAPLPSVEHVAEHEGRLAHRDPADAPRGQVVRDDYST